MLNVPFLLGTDEHCRAHTGLSLGEFAHVLILYEAEYALHMNALYEKKHGKKRTRKLGGGRGGALKTIEQKLFFVLYYLKTYQTYATLGGAFGLPRSKAYAWIDILLPPLGNALKKTAWFLRPTLLAWQGSLGNARKFGTYS